MSPVRVFFGGLWLFWGLQNSKSELESEGVGADPDDRARQIDRYNPIAEPESVGPDLGGAPGGDDFVPGVGVGGDDGYDGGRVGGADRNRKPMKTAPPWLGKSNKHRRGQPVNTVGQVRLVRRQLLDHLAEQRVRCRSP